MRGKKILVHFFLICLFFNVTSLEVYGNLFRDAYSVPVKIKVNSFKMDVYDRFIGFLLQDSAKKLWYIGSLDGGSSFTSKLKIAPAGTEEYTLALNSSLSVLLWVDGNQKKINYMLLDNSKRMILYKGTLYKYNCEAVYQLQALFNFDDDEISMVFIEHYKHHSNLRFIKFSIVGEILKNQVLYYKGYNFLPQIKKINKTYLLVWSNLAGDSEEIFYSFSDNNGEDWSSAVQLTYNNFNDRVSYLCEGKDKFYLVWQDNRLGNWNISYEEFFIKDRRWVNFSRVTSGLIYYWLPYVGIYKNKIFVTWIDKSKGTPDISLKTRNNNQNIWSLQQQLCSKMDNLTFYRLATSRNFILLSYLKNKQLYFSKLYSPVDTISINKKKIRNNGYKLTWDIPQKDVDKYVIHFFGRKINNAFVPVLSKKENSFFIYLNHPTKLNDFFFNIKYRDDIGILSKGFSSLISTGGKFKQNIIDWRNIDNNQIYYNIMKHKLYITFSYHKGMTKETILNRLYFYVINQLNQDNIYSKNKFVQIFDLINDNMDFNRLIEGDKIFLPMLWGNIQFISIIKKDVESTLKKIDDIYNLKNKGYIYYVISHNLKKIKRYEQAKQNDFLVIIIPY